MRSISVQPTRCAFIVCKVLRGGLPHILLLRDERWGDFTFLGGHEEPKDDGDLDNTARREAAEELGLSCATVGFRVFPLTEEIRFGPIRSKSTQEVKSYSFKFYSIEFDREPALPEGQNEAGFLLKFVEEQNLHRESDLSNVVQVFLDHFRNKLGVIPLSWDAAGRLRDGRRAGEGIEHRKILEVAG